MKKSYEMKVQAAPSIAGYRRAIIMILITGRWTPMDWMAMDSDAIRRFINKSTATRNQPTSAKDGAQRKRDHDRRKREAGMKEFRAWVTPVELVKLRVFLLELRRLGGA